MASNTGAPWSLPLIAGGDVFDIVKDYNALTTKVKTALDTLQTGIDGIATAIGINPSGVPWAMATGQASITVASGQTSGEAWVTMPAGRFTLVPIATATVLTSTRENFYIVIDNSIGGAAPTKDRVGFKCVNRNGNAATSAETISFQWIAIQMKKTSAGG